MVLSTAFFIQLRRRKIIFGNQNGFPLFLFQEIRIQVLFPQLFPLIPISLNRPLSIKTNNQRISPLKPIEP